MRKWLWSTGVCGNPSQPLWMRRAFSSVLDFSFHVRNIKLTYGAVRRWTVWLQIKHINMHVADALLGMVVNFTVEFWKWDNIRVMISSKAARNHALHNYSKYVCLCPQWGPDCLYNIYFVWNRVSIWGQNMGHWSVSPDIQKVLPTVQIHSLIPTAAFSWP